MIKAFETINGVRIPYVIDPRRPGDIGICYAAPEKALEELNWKAERTIEDMVRDAWNWQKNNPNGYEE